MDGLRTRVVVLLVVTLLAIALGGQALADSLVPEASAADTNAAVGRATSSYLTGVRSYAAAALWNRLDPLMHGYYGGVSLTDMRYMLSSISLIVALDPQFIHAYPVGSWILVQNGRVDDGLAMARRAVEANPRSGMLLSNRAQLEYLYGDDLSAAVQTAERAIESDVVWTDLREQHTWLPILGDIFRQGDRDDLDAIVQAELVRIDEEAGDSLAPEEHDHDHDGVPDH
ncbi:MAG: hypothetical protein JW733_05355 [Coriobacteriia bacterium]|nr:hypothetical protein [Coriobacteriia bacterium]MBN2839590.1 hypothetical protein [Coriobacteriia bacterium]